MYVKLEDFWKEIEIQAGDIVFVSSDITKIGIDAKRHGEHIESHKWIDALIRSVGKTGTVIFPTYNWDFCKGIPFDYYKTPGVTGALGKYALMRTDFRRTRHPIYSFAVYGKYRDFLCEMNNKAGFGQDSPFGFFREKNVKNYFIDVSLKNSFSYAHYVERCSGKVDYRIEKVFCAEYIDENKEVSQREYSSFMRNWDFKPNEILLDPMEEDLISAGVEKKYIVNRSEIKLIYLGAAYDIILRDILDNGSKKLCAVERNGG